jgi:cell wall-associated NlpC family hydrolase
MRPHPFHTRTGSPAARLALAAVLLLAAIATALALMGTPASASIATKQAALNDVQDQKATVSDQLASSNDEINSLIAQVSEARQREEAAAAELAQTQQDLEDASAELADGRDHLQQVREQLARAIDELEKILVGIYKSDDPEMIKLLIESSDWEDASVDAAYLDRVHDYQLDTVQRVKDLRADAADTVARLADTRERIAEARDAIAQRHDQLAGIRSSLESQEADLAAARAARRETLARLSGREDALQSGIDKAQRRQAAAVPPPVPEPAADPSTVAAPPVSAPAPSGSTATLNSDGSATAPADAPPQVVAVINAANEIRDMPYVWGGGHGSFESSGYDCSGAVSYALHGGGFLSSPLDSTGLAYWGEEGSGNWITVYANSGHAWMMVAGLRWDTSDTGGDGPSWSASSSSWESSQSWAVRHPAGF